MNRTIWLAHFLLAMALPALSLALPAGFIAEILATGLDAVAVKVAPDGRVFFTEKKGDIRIWKGDRILAAPFVDISAQVDGTMEKGMLGLALDPDFTANGFVYAFYVDKNHSGYVMRWTANGDVAAPGSGQRIFDAGVTGDGDFHHGGDIAFGPDGKLYLTRGNHQNTDYSKDQTSLYGKLLRINRDGSIPDDNPRYAANQGNARAVYAWGLRNPQSLAPDLDKGRMFFLDIADATVDDEINLVEKGAHYGAYSAGTAPGLIKKGEGGSAIMGCVYYGKRRMGDRPAFPAEYQGKLFWGQFGGNGIRILDPDTKKTTRFDDNINAPINFDISGQGALYLVTRSTQVLDKKGNLIRIRYPAGETVALAGSPGGEAMGMAWRRVAGSGLEVEVRSPGQQSLELRALSGSLLAIKEIAGSGSYFFPGDGYQGLRILALRSGRGISRALVSAR